MMSSSSAVWVLSRSGAKHRIASPVKAGEGGNNLVPKQPL
jgi:hypothetical protein